MRAHILGITILAVCLVGKVMGWIAPFYSLPQLEPSMPTDEDEAGKDTQIMVPSIPVGIGLENLPLEMLWKEVLKNPSVMSDGVPQPGMILSPTEEIFFKLFPEHKSKNIQSNKISSDFRRGILLDYLAQEGMTYSAIIQHLQQGNHSGDMQVQNMNGNTLNFTMDQEEMLFINGIKVNEVRSRSDDKGPFVYIIGGSLFNHMDMVKPELDHQKNKNATGIDGRSYLEPSF
ncbi:unnamed protein product [Meganyctiphanes norvegica]|uniref:Uncharacterized protein n=1 Tax=Meganyctiphanes norvegica TaxID=48144 RepID=A0AAV2QLC6_MEGNR